MDKESKNELIGGLIGLVVIILFCLLTSCRTQIKYVPVETIRTDSVFFNSVRIDSVLIHDSISIIQRGDTVAEYRYRYIYKYKDRVDTLYINRTDSIQVSYPVEIEKKLTLWQQTKIKFGGWAIAVIIVTILIVVGRMVYKLKK
nr:MAG TPA: hypothetical protein [Caudoviricetes sp.]